MSHPFPSYTDNMLGIHDYVNKPSSLNLFEILTTYRLELYKLAREFEDVFVLDIDNALEKEGKNPQGLLKG